MPSTATIGVTFDGDACTVTITSTKGISNYVVTDSHGTTKIELDTEVTTIVIQLAPGETITIESVKSGTTTAGPFGPFTCPPDDHDGGDDGHDGHH